MLPCNHLDRIHVAFDDHRLVANAGLLLPVTLAHHLGLGELVDNHVDLGDAPGRARSRPTASRMPQPTRGQNMIRWIVAFGLVATLAVVLMVAFAFTGNHQETTEDIDAIYDRPEKTLEAATFAPGVDRETVVTTSLNKVGNMLEGIDTSTLETRATVGLYAGKNNRGDQVTQLKVWQVVHDDLPMVFPSGPFDNAVDRSGQRQQNQLVIFFDASTGAEVEGTTSGRWVSE